LIIEMFAQCISIRIQILVCDEYNLLRGSYHTYLVVILILSVKLLFRLKQKRIM
jgi:hypothetical protein